MSNESRRAFLRSGAALAASAAFAPLLPRSAFAQAGGARPAPPPTPAAVWPPPPMTTLLPTPPQDQGLPYTRSARPMALERIAGCTVVFPGSRYAYVDGRKVRLDEDHWRDEAVAQDGTVYVPLSFTGLLGEKALKADTPLPYLTDRWVSTVERPQARVPNGMATITVEGRPYVDLVAAANAAGLKAVRHPRGLVLVGKVPPTLEGVDPTHVDALITLFDTPEKFADPTIAAGIIPTLVRQGTMFDHVKVTPEQMAILHGPGTVWPTAPKTAYDETGFDAALLGSPVPPPGVHPRVLFSPEDVPRISERIRSTKVGQMSLIEIDFLLHKSFWDPATDDGRIFQKLVSGDTSGLAFPTTPGSSWGSYPAAIQGLFAGEKASIYNSHVEYVPECLTTMALYCLLTGDDDHGRQAAAAIASYFRIIEPQLDVANSISDTEYGGTFTTPDGEQIAMNGAGGQTHMRTVAEIIAYMNTGLALDFAGKWMTDDEKATMHRIIAKATYGRRAYGQDGSVRFRDINWVAWDTPHFLALAAIEGLPGFDREAFESNAETVRAYCDWGMDDHGVIYESNGKTPGALQFQTLSMVTLARRGENLFGHPHWRKMLDAQVQMTSPSGAVTVNSGTQYVPFSRQRVSLMFCDERKAFYPGENASSYLITQGVLHEPGDADVREWDMAGFTPEEFAAKVGSIPRQRMPSPTYPGINNPHSVLYDADYPPTTREELGMPLAFDAPVHGVFSCYSDHSNHAAWMNIMVRPDHYLGAGHHHADAGMFHFSGGGIDWFTQSPFDQVYDGRYYNLVQVDGHSEPETIPNQILGYQAPATYLGAVSNDDGGFAAADLTNSYSYRWLTQPPQVWSDELKALPWELDPSPANLQKFAGTARMKMRFWWSNYTYSNYIATSRAPFNPMQYVYRNVGLVRGPHPYGIVVDDLKKDDRTHLYQWAAMLNGGVWRAAVDNLPQGMVALGYQNVDTDSGPATAAPLPPITPNAGDPLLLVCPLGAAGDDLSLHVTTEQGPPDKKGAPQYYNRLTINHSGTDAHYKVVLVPHRHGQPLPKITYDAAAKKATVVWPEGTDELAFLPTSGTAERTTVRVSRGGKTLIEAV